LYLKGDPVREKSAENKLRNFYSIFSANINIENMTNALIWHVSWREMH